MHDGRSTWREAVAVLDDLGPSLFADEVRTNCCDRTRGHECGLKAAVTTMRGRRRLEAAMAKGRTVHGDVPGQGLRRAGQDRE
jgi:hypothetical protein